MKKTAVVYWSGTGNTEAMAKAVAEGMESAGAQVTMLTPDQVKASELSAYDAIAFGCPAMGSEVLEEMEFQPMFDSIKNQMGGKAVGLTGRDGGLIRAKKLKMLDNKDPSIEHDVGQVGDIVAIDPSVVKALQDDAFIPVISPIGFGEENESYNINADVVASKLATVLQAEKLVLLTNTPGVLDKAGNLLTDLTAREIDALFADGTISGGMLPKISGALDAAKAGVNAVHIIDGRVPHSMLLEILTDQAYGTMIRSH